MRVTVFGATGKIGRFVTEQLLTAGHQVTALVRNPAKLALTDDKLTVITGQLTDPDTVRKAVHGADAVISALGPSLRPFASGTPLTEGTTHIVAAMRAEGVRRFIGLATPSVADPRDEPHWKQKVLPVMAKLMFPNALTELRGMTAAVVGSDLEWTLARITNPTDKAPTGHVRAGFLGRDDVGSATSRADIAAFLVAQLDDTTYLNASPVVSN